MASTNTQKQAAKAFVQEWSGKGYDMDMSAKARQSDGVEFTKK